MLPSGIATVVETTERDAWASFVEACPPPLAEGLGVRVERIGALLVTSVAAIDHPVFNRVTCVGVPAPVREAELDRALEVLRANGSRSYHVYVSPAAQPAELPRWLEERGLGRDGAFVKLLRDARPAPRAEGALEVRAVDAGAAEAFGAAACEAFELPPDLVPWFAAVARKPGWRAYAAHEPDTGEAVAVGALAIFGSRAWLGIAGTRPSQRRRGGQSLLLARRIDDALGAGATALCTEMPEPPLGDPASARNAERAGFTLVYRRETWAPPA